MNKEEFKKLLEDNLTIELRTIMIDYNNTAFEIKIKFDDEIICSDWIYLSQLKD
jgi:hypothetical protein